MPFLLNSRFTVATEADLIVLNIDFNVFKFSFSLGINLERSLAFKEKNT